MVIIEISEEQTVDIGFEDGRPVAVYSTETHFNATVVEDGYPQRSGGSSHRTMADAVREWNRRNGRPYFTPGT